MAGRWSSIGPINAISLIGLQETLMGGQSFAWSSKADNQWIGVVGHSIVELKWIEGQIRWRSFGPQPIGKNELLDYLWLDKSYSVAVDSLPWRSDEVLHRAIRMFPGLRVLRQSIDETLLMFLLSTAKSIPQIKQLRDKIYQLLGLELKKDLHAFPGWKKIKSLTEMEARKLGMGYRAKYLIGTARFLGRNPDFLKSLKNLSHNQAKVKLMELPGVGPKVADCVLLFGGVAPQAFPVDTWIFQSLQKQYGMIGWKIPQMEEFARIHFGINAGLAQQFLFSYERYLKKKASKQ